MSQSSNTTDQPIANQQAAGQQTSSTNAQASSSTNAQASSSTTASTIQAFIPSLTPRGQRAQGRATQQENPQSQPTATSAFLPNANFAEDDGWQQWAEQLATVACEELDKIHRSERALQERAAFAGGSTLEDVEAARNLLNLPHRAKAVEEEEVALAQKRGWRRG